MPRADRLMRRFWRNLSSPTPEPARPAPTPCSEPALDCAQDIGAYAGFNLAFEPGAGVRVFVATLAPAAHHWTRFLGPRDVVIFYDPWSLRPEIAQAAEAAARVPENLYFLCADWQTYRLRRKAVRNAHLVNQNCFLDEALFDVEPGVEKVYDAIYNSRRMRMKRHHLAAEVGEKLDLALIVPQVEAHVYDLPLGKLPAHVYRNDAMLKPADVAHRINMSRVGLILSEIEGACFASSEYLLCGVPVVSTPSKGGRSFWYTDENSVIVDPHPRAVLEGVCRLIDAPPDPMRVRRAHLDLMRAQRRVLAEEVLGAIARRFRLYGWDPAAALAACDLAREFAFKKEGGWVTVAAIRRRLRELNATHAPEANQRTPAGA